MENQKKRNGLLLSVLGVLGLVLITAGVTYAFFNYQKEGQTENVIRTGSITFEYTEGNGQINITDALPMSDADGMASENTQQFTFTIDHTNTGSQAITYYVTAKKLASSTLAEDQVKMYLSTATTGTNAASSPVLYSALDSVFKETNSTPDYPAFLRTAVGTLASGEAERVLFTGTVAGASGTGTENFTLKMWLNGAAGSGSIADYSPYEFVNKTASTGTDTYTVTAAYCKDSTGATVSGVSDQSTCEGTTGNTWVPAFTVPMATSTSELDAEQQIRNKNFITSKTYYALGDTDACSDGTSQDSSTCTANGAIWGKRSDYERVAYVNTTTKKIITLSQAVKMQSDAGTVSTFVDQYGNYALTGTAPSGYTVSEQYYQVNGQTFKVKVNVYANATVAQPQNNNNNG